jgi:hypothetical protein
VVRGTGQRERLDVRWGWGSAQEGAQAEGASSYKRMINDNSAGNKTKHPSYCQSSEASTWLDEAPNSDLLLEEVGALCPLLLRVSSTIHLPWGGLLNLQVGGYPGVGERWKST